MFTEALLTVTKTYKQPKNPSINELLSIHRVEHYSAIKGKEILMHTTTWMTSKEIILGEINKSQEHRYCMIPLT